MSSSTSSTSSTSSSSANSTLNQMLRLSGMSSGLDTDSIIQALMKAENAKLDKLNQQKTKLEWKKDALTSIKTQISSLTTKYMSILSPDNMYTSSVYKMYDVAMDTTTNAVSITANSKASAGSHTINKITSLATATNMSSSTKISGGTGISTSTSLKDLALTTPLTFQDNMISFKINDQYFSFDEDDTVQTVINEVNGSDANVTMSYSSLSDGFTIKSDTTGKDGTLTITNLTGNAFASTGAAFGIAQGTSSNGTNAVLQIDGYDVDKTTNSFTIDGMNFTLKEESATPINFTVNQDVDSTVDKIKAFVKDYNSLVDALNSKITEKKNYDYSPLTESQQDGMSDDEIEKWNEQAKSGILRNDNEVSQLLSSMRSMIYDKVEGVGKSLSDIGLNTGSYENNGEIVIDETKLRKALTTNPDEVSQIFTRSSDSTVSSDKYNQSGFFARMTSAINDYTDNSSISDIDDDMDDLDDKIDDMKEYLADKQENYYNQYASLESSLYQLQTQQSWLAQQFS